MASPSLNPAFGNDSQEFDSVHQRQRLSKPSDFDSWKKVFFERLRERGLSHVPLVPPAASDRERDDRFQRRPTADELRRVTVALKFSVVARYRNEFLGGSLFHGEKPWEIWSEILEWAGKRPEDENHGASYTSPKPVRPPPAPRFSFDKLSSLLQSIATIGLASYDSFEAYVTRFDNLRKQLVAISCSLNQKQYIAFFIMGIKDAEEHRRWIRDVKEKIETHPAISLDQVMSIASADVKERKKGHGPYETPSTRHHSHSYHRKEADSMEGFSYDSCRPAHDGGRGKDPKSPPNAHVNFHTQERPRGKTAVDNEAPKKPYIRAQEDLFRTDRSSTPSKPSYENINEKSTSICFAERLRTQSKQVDEENVPGQVRKLSTTIDSNNSTAGERRALSGTVGVTETIPSQPPMPVISKTATPTVKKVTFDDRPQSDGGAGIDGKKAVPVGQNTNKTSNTQIRGLSSANVSSSNQTKSDGIDPNLTTTSPVLPRPSTTQQPLGDRPEPADGAGTNGKSAATAGQTTNTTSSFRIRDLGRASSSSPNQAKADNVDSNSTTTSPARPQPSTVSQRKFSAAETERISNHSPARSSTTIPQISQSQANPSVPSPDKPLHGSRKSSPVTSVSSPKLPAAVTGGAVKEKVVVNTGSRSSPVLPNADTSRSPKEAPNSMAQESESSQKLRNDTPPVSKKRELEDEPDKEPSTTGPPIKKRVSAKQLMQNQMASPSRASDSENSGFDSAQPFRGVVVCCTSIPVEQRTEPPPPQAEIAQKAAELGGIHKYDLTPDVTHLIVGEYDTPKYRHVAKERPDIKPMAAGWIDAVCSLFTMAEPINFKALEREWRLKTFETDGGNGRGRGKLLICLTGFDDVHQPRGRKYAAAKDWQIRTVSIEWVRDSVERGMILDESLYDPLLPLEERGLNAWNRNAPARRSAAGSKRTRDASFAAKEGGAPDDRKTKLRRTASLKLSNQRDGLWGDILGKPAHSKPSPVSVEAAPPEQEIPAVSAASLAEGNSSSFRTSFVAPDAKKTPAPPPFEIPKERPVYDSCCCYVHGFSRRQTEILVNTLVSLGGHVCSSLEELSLEKGSQYSHRILIVPQESQPESHPRLPSGASIVTEFFIEKCLHKKQFFDPNHHVIGRPFPRFPIQGFESLGVATSGFTGVDLNQIDKTIRQLGARYDERFTANTSMLLCTSLQAVRKQKLDLALAWKVPVIQADWLWTCISTGYKVPFRDFMYKELNQSITPPRTLSANTDLTRSRSAPSDKENESLRRTKSASASRPSTTESTSAQAPAHPAAPKSASDATSAVPVQAGNTESAEKAGEHETEPTQEESGHSKESKDVTATSDRSRDISEPLATKPASALNKTPPEQQSHAEETSAVGEEQAQPNNKPAAQRKLARIASEVADSDDDDSDEDALAVAAREASAQRAREKKLKDEANRLALCSKLTSLLDGKTSAPGSADEQDASGGQSAVAGAAPQPARRKRKIMGRAVSNVSIGSNGSGGGSADAASAAGDKNSVAGADDNKTKENAPPPATQLVYDAPHADYFMAQLRAGVADGTKGPPKDAGGGEKLTLKDLQQPQQQYGASAAGRRTRRR
ncbi:hypothetical protein PspLS_02299 [Pyricularia sp. CBS 133598]|nr:hypothetical protein PspLS_02299 [Pyricularia sp. CBS 133598]